jgi:hypothetical protein
LQALNYFLLRYAARAILDDRLSGIVKMPFDNWLEARLSAHASSSRIGQDNENFSIVLLNGERFRQCRGV